MTPSKFNGWSYQPLPWHAYFDPKRDNADVGAALADQQKMNLLWLIYPGMDEHGAAVVPAKHIAAIHRHFSRDIREMLRDIPVDFVEAFLEIEPWTLEILRHAPVSCLKTMRERAYAAQSRMVAELNISTLGTGNVTYQ